MLPVAGQTAGPIGLTFFVDIHGGVIGKKNFFNFSKIFLNFFFFFFKYFFPWATPGPPASIEYF